MKVLGKWSIRITEIFLVAIVASSFESPALAIVGGIILGGIWALNDRTSEER